MGNALVTFFLALDKPYTWQVCLQIVPTWRDGLTLKLTDQLFVQTGQQIELSGHPPTLGQPVLQIACWGTVAMDHPISLLPLGQKIMILLVGLTSQSRAGLKERGFLTSELESLFQRFEDMLVFLRDVSVKELNNETLTQQEYDQIMVFGGQLELLTISIAGGEILSETDKDMAVIADVHTAGGDCLEEGVGHAAEIYVVVPIEGKLYLTRGAMFTYYEFEHPVSDRLTDEKWQKMLSDKTAPSMPDWTKSFMLPETEKVDIRREGYYSTGC